MFFESILSSGKQPQDPQHRTQETRHHMLIIVGEPYGGLDALKECISRRTMYNASIVQVRPKPIWKLPHVGKTAIAMALGCVAEMTGKQGAGLGTFSVAWALFGVSLDHPVQFQPRCNHIHLITTAEADELPSGATLGIFTGRDTIALRTELTNRGRTYRLLNPDEPVKDIVDEIKILA